MLTSKSQQMENAMLYISIRDLQASDNRYIEHDGLFMIFSSDEEIDDFINAIDSKHVIEKAEKKANTDDLFK